MIVLNIDADSFYRHEFQHCAQPPGQQGSRVPHPARKKRQRGAWQPNVGTESRSQWICSQTRQACACSWEACYPVSYLLQRQKGGLSTRRRICLDSLGETGNCHFVVTPCAGVECTGHSWSQCEVALIANTQATGLQRQAAG